MHVKISHDARVITILVLVLNFLLGLYDSQRLKICFSLLLNCLIYKPNEEEFSSQLHFPSRQCVTFSKSQIKMNQMAAHSSVIRFLAEIQNITRFDRIIENAEVSRFLL